MIIPPKPNGNGKNGHLVKIISSVAATFIAGVFLLIGGMVVRQTRTNTQNINNNFNRIEKIEKALWPNATPWPKQPDEVPQ